MKLQRAIGQTSQILLLFVQDASVSTGAGLANVIGSSVSYTWFHNNQISVSTGTASTAGTTGTFSTSAWTMISSSNALGWYQFGAPDGVFATGDSVGIHFYNAPNMVPLPVEIELVRDNPQQFSSSKVFLAHTSTSPANIVQAVGQPIVTSGAGILNVSTQSLTGIVVSTQSLAGIVVSTQSLANITTFANLIAIYGTAAVTSAGGQLQVSTQSLVGITTAANIIQVYGSAVVTSASGQFRVSTQSLVGITTAANLIQVYGSAIVTSGAGILNVSTQTLPAGGSGDISTIYGQPIVTSAAGILDINLINILNQPVVTSGAGILNVSTQTLAAGAGDIISVYGVPIVTSGAGIIRVSTQAIDKGGYGVTTNADKSGYALTAAYDPAKTAAQSSDARFTNLDTNVGSRATPNDILATPLNESYRAFNSTGTLIQLMYEVVANVTDMVNSGTSRTLNSVTSHTAITVQYQYDSTTPSAISRIA